MRAFDRQRISATMKDDAVGFDEPILHEDGGVGAARVDELFVNFDGEIVDVVAREEDRVVGSGSEGRGLAREHLEAVVFATSGGKRKGGRG